MPRISSLLLYSAILIGLGPGSGSCIAKPIIDEPLVLRICEALSQSDPGRMPEAVAPEAARKFLEHYRVDSKLLRGCRAATQTRSAENRTIFRVEHDVVEAYWQFYTDNNFIQQIVIEHYRYVTLAGDGPWIPLSGSHSGLITDRGGDTVFGSNLDRNIIEFFFATNRKESNARPVLEGDPPPNSVAGAANGWTLVSDYTGERAGLSFGAVRVRVPEGHQIGKVELPWSAEIFGLTFESKSDPEKHFALRSIQKVDEAAWIKSLSRSGKKRALIFVHGFNTSFRDAVFRTAQIAWDLQFGGTTVLFSWPSRGEVTSYLYDKDSALGSRDALLHVIADVRKAGFDQIDIIAHSMGNLIAVDALAHSATTNSPTAIAQLIMAAPDVDRDIFIQGIPNVAKVTKGLTLYASKNDKALQLSKRVAGDIPRAGDVPEGGPIVLPGLWTIDVSLMGDELFGLNHNTFASTRSVLNDLAILLNEGKAPPRLVEIRGFPEPPLKAAYFRYVP
ncbi:alpha/beta hydrolase [Bradyrhizobium stylosanthis]|uniref:Esterase/lipase superfamily enzyme n=1 Tax=Bradyrhizobium stylosanthis TaxID=1803665 RepID=A0A560DIL8_9BRAD|nr:alpha/beta fold hydrolase [Bradyrhizobium stylosanthis]TWA96960.1 esterase/lipase superfamily enzyme [Bradyrhizobium stylosanthis]